MKRKLNPLYCLYCAIAGLVIFLIAAYQMGVFSADHVRELFGALSDAFIIPGVLLSGIAAISWTGSLGTYDMIGYGMKSLFFFLPNSDLKKYRTFYDYRHAKEEKGRWWLREMLLVGCGFLLCGVICFVVYSLY